MVPTQPHSASTKRPFSEPKWVTPEESWTTNELVGGGAGSTNLSDCDSEPGHLLDAIAEDRWLVLDETNRADMDKSFGPVLAWLSSVRSDEHVELGRASTQLDAPRVVAWLEGRARVSRQPARSAGVRIRRIKISKLSF